MKAEFIETNKRLFGVLNAKDPLGKGTSAPLRWRNLRIMNSAATKMYESLKLPDELPVFKSERKCAALGLIGNTMVFRHLESLMESKTLDLDYLLG